MGMGFIAAATGAASGLGAGLNTVGQYGLKEQMMEKMNELATKREATIERLRAGYAQQAQARGQTFEMKKVGVEIGARSRAAVAQRTFEAGESALGRASKEKIGFRRAGATENAAATRADAMRSHTTGGTPKWVMQPRTAADGSQSTVLMSPNGRTYNPNGQMYVPEGTDPKTLRQATPQQLQKLLQDPFAKLPSGATAIESFERNFGYLPSTVVPRLQQGAPGTTASNTSTTRGVQGPGYTPTKEEQPPVGEEDSQGEADARELELQQQQDDEEPSEPSGGMAAYDNAAPQ